MAKLLFVTEFFPPESFSGANRIAATADVLAAEHDVVVVTLLPSYPNPSLYGGTLAVESDARRPYPIKRTFHFTPHSPSLLVRGLREQLMALRLGRIAVRQSADAVLTSSPSMFLGPVCLLIARLKSASFVWDIRDLNWEYAAESQGRSPLVRAALAVLRRYMWFTARRADLVVAATPGIARVVGDHGVDHSKTIVVANTIAKELVEAARDVLEKVEKARPLVAYVGLLGEPQALGVLVDVAARLPAVDFVLAGEGLERAALEERAARLGLENVTFAGYLARSSVLELYRQADVLFAQLKESEIHTRTALPSKLFEYMAVSRPIVYAGRGPAAETVERVGCGVAVRPEDAGAIAAAIARLVEQEEQAAEMGRKGRAFVERSATREEAMETLAIALRDRLGLQSGKSSA